MNDPDTKEEGDAPYSACAQVDRKWTPSVCKLQEDVGEEERKIVSVGNGLESILSFAA